MIKFSHINYVDTLWEHEETPNCVIIVGIVSNVSFEVVVRKESQSIFEMAMGAVKLLSNGSIIRNVLHLHGLHLGFEMPQIASH